MAHLTIGRHHVSASTQAYVIAEIGHNHEGSLDKAEELFRAAAAAGAQAVKLQKRENKDLFTKEMYNRPYTGRNSYGATYGLHREALEFGHAEYSHLSQVAKELGLDFFSTAFDIPSVDFVVEHDLPAIKIASADLTNTPLLAYAAKTQRPLIVSTGGGSMDDVRRACETVLEHNSRLALLQCTAVYPAAPADLNLSVINTYQEEFPDVVVGFSGHDLGPELSWIAYALGARVIEKHFTLDQSSPGSDHHFSLDPAQLAELVSGLQRTHQAIGSPAKAVGGNEEAAIQKMGKKLVAARALEAGHVLQESDVLVKSPGDGLPPYLLPQIVGRRLIAPIQADEGFELESLEPLPAKV
ncbi:N-acetylneuraminate synthase [Streptomyces coacervatus]|uniref:N-acetylneuraminate synthase n=1 Tax=Streptomyces coacervatus TaxID=647381 RepID=A0ABP7HKM8_9ACTN|nr:N-acetylneuraminate synthase family protein [Streptomyces coacervatus]MDF2272053.1 N-acetylneuraminate synthase family protein [Streptomyces coacervatus]